MISPQFSLILGLCIGFFLKSDHPIRIRSKKVSTKLLQASVVLFGAGLNFHHIINSGLQGVLVTFSSIALTFALGLAFAKFFKIPSPLSTLITAGTAICGGSAIAALIPVLKPNKMDIATSIGIVFLLNAAAVFIFPPLGHWAGLTEVQFGTWAALAIHDTSSVVAASQVYGHEALTAGTTLKLTRALWILPLVLMLSWNQRANRTEAKPPLPWFIFLFVVVSVLFTFFEPIRSYAGGVQSLAKNGFALSLFFIGLQIDRHQLMQIPVRVVYYAVLLWLFVTSVSLGFILIGQN